MFLVLTKISIVVAGISVVSMSSVVAEISIVVANMSFVLVMFSRPLCSPQSGLLLSQQCQYVVQDVYK